MKRIALVILGAALLGVLVALVFRSPEKVEDLPQSIPERAPEFQAEVDTFEDVPQHAGTPFLATGDLRRYRYRSVTSVRISLAEGATEMTMRAGGELSVRTYDVSGPLVQGYRFLPIVLVATNDMVGDLSDFRSVQSQLETEFLVRRDPLGKILSIHFEEGIGKESRNILRGLLAPFEIVLGGPDEEKWENRGDDTTGKFLAEYTVENRSAEGLDLTRRKQYQDLYFSGIPTSLETGESPFHVEGGGETRISLDPAEQLTRLAGRERVKMEGKNGQMTLGVASRMEVFAVLIGMERNDPGVLARAADLRHGLPGMSFVDFAPETTLEKMTTVEIGDLDDLLDRLVKATAEGEWYKEAPHVYMALRELLENSPEARLRVQEMLANGEYAGEVLQTLADALGSTTSGWKEILSLMDREELDPLRKLILTRSLGLVPRPGEEVVGLLSKLARDEEDAFSALMAIRSLGLSAGLPNNLDLRDVLADELAPLLGGPSERDVQVLNSLGNAGSPGTLPAILELAGSSNEEIRAAVAGAVRKIDDPKVEILLAKLAGDSSPMVRFAVVGALAGKGGEKSSLLLKKIWMSDLDEGVRLEALQYFAACPQSDSFAVQVLSEASGNAPSPKVRAYAANALKNMATE